VEVIADSIKMAVDIDGSKPDSDVSRSGTTAFLHLTRNADPIIQGRMSPDEANQSAINIEAFIDIKLAAGEDIKNSSFRLIQIMAITNDYILLLGRTSADGRITVNSSQPPAMPQKFANEFMLDCTPEAIPFTNLRPPVVFDKRDAAGHVIGNVKTISTSMDDHPNKEILTSYKNMKTGQTNYLAEAELEDLFITSLVIRNETTKVIETFGYVTWKASWHANYRWIDGKCQPYNVTGTLFADPIVKGPPKTKIWGRSADYILQKIVKPATDFKECANAVSDAANQALADHPMFWNMDYADKWPAAVPANFWTGR
jgi:hypothetical protein